MKSNNQIITFAMFLVMISVLAVSNVSADTYVGDSPYLTVTAEEVSPEPVEPGQDVTVKIRLTNEGGATAENVALELNIDYPFSLKTESNNFENTQTLCVGCSIDNTYYLVVDANAKSGLYPLDFEIHSDEGITRPDETIDINVIGKPDVILETKMLDVDISSGDSFTFQFSVKNIGTGIARNVKITPQSDDILMLGSNFNLVSEIEPGKTVLFSSDFIVKESLVPDTYKFPIMLEYVDEQGTSYAASFDVGVNVLNRADIGFQSIKITPTNPTLIDDVHMEGIIENTGTGNADKVTVELITSDGKTYKAFIGQLQADDDAPFYFDAKPESVGVQTATLKVSYDDDFGAHTYETTIEKEVGRPTSNLITIIIVLLVAIGIGGYFYFKRKKAKK